MHSQLEKHPINHTPINTSDRISIVNALMAEDRQEVRGHQNSLWNLSYLMVAASVGIAASFFDNADAAHQNFRVILIIGQLLLLLLYVVVFLVTALKWLPDARACLTIREAYYHNKQQLLYKDHFDPLRHTEPQDYKNSLIDKYFWIPFCISVITSTVTLLFMLYL